jgi:hypothetical protein
MTVSLVANAQDATKAWTPALSPTSTQELSMDMSLAVSRVAELRFIQQEALKMGVRAFLFGGTAASFGNYVSWEQRLQNGDARLKANSFEYDMTDIFLENQDLDIVLDGTAEQTEKLQKLLDSKFPYKLAGKSAWEVRSLRHPMGPKTALLGDREFLNQHSDSSSTGLIDLSPGTQKILWDLRDWNSAEPRALQDMAQGKITYYYSPSHNQTKMAMDGKNPEILSVLRLLVKAVQFDLEIRSEDLANIQRVINQFDPKSVTDSYVSYRLKATAKKLVTNSINVERTFALLNQLNLRSKLIQLASATSDQTLAELITKEPLKSKTVGQGSGKTAKELGISSVAHDTRTLEAYTNIMRSLNGEPNVFISRKDTPGETAVFGDGFYTAKGTQGTGGFNVQILLNPNAREGSDFELANDGKYIVIKNKKALLLNPEKTKMNFMEMVQFVNTKRTSKDVTTDDANNARILNKLSTRLNSISQQEMDQLHQVLTSQFDPQNSGSVSLLVTCAKSPQCFDQKTKDTLTPAVRESIQSIIDISQGDFTSESIGKKILAATRLSLSYSFQSKLKSQVEKDIDTLPRDAKVAFMSALVDFDRQLVNKILDTMTLANSPDLAPVIAKLPQMGTVYEYLTSNSNAAQAQVLSEAAKRDYYFASQMLAMLDLNNRPDLLPAMETLAKNMTPNDFTFEVGVALDHYIAGNNDYVKYQLGRVIAERFKDAKTDMQKAPQYPVEVFKTMKLENRIQLAKNFANFDAADNIIALLIAEVYFLEGYPQVVKELLISLKKSIHPDNFPQLKIAQDKFNSTSRNFLYKMLFKKTEAEISALWDELYKSKGNSLNLTDFQNENLKKWTASYHNANGKSCTSVFGK